MNTKTKLTALLMSILMIVAMIPTFALTVTAAEIEAGDVAAVYDSNNALVDGYATFEAAWDEATKYDNYTVQLLANTFVSQNGAHANFARQIATGKTLTVDLNGYVLTPVAAGTAARPHFLVQASSTLKIVDSRPKAEHWYSVDTSVTNFNSGIYTWNQEAETDEAARADLTKLCGGALTGGCNNDGTYGAGAIYVRGDATLEIYGGNFVGNEGSIAGAIKVGHDDQNKGSLKVYDGTFIGNKVNAAVLQVNLYFIAVNTVSIEGGTFVKARTHDKDKKIAQGWNDEYLKSGYGLANDAQYTTTVVPFVAEVINGTTTTCYASFADAYNAASEGSTIKLLKNTYANAIPQHNNFSLAITKSVTLDLNGCILTPTGNGDQRPHFLVQNNNAVFKIIDSNPTAVHKYKNENNRYVLDEEKGNIVICGGALTGGYNNDDTYGAGAISVRNGTTVEIYGGNFVGNAGKKVGAIRMIKNSSTGSLKVYGGTFIGNVLINYDGSGTYLPTNSNIDFYDPNTVSIAGGTFVTGSSANVGGFSNWNDEYLAEGYSLVDNTTYAGAVSAMPFTIRGLQTSENSNAIRLIAEVDQALLTGATEAGFKVSLKVGDGEAGEVKTLNSKYYYTKLLAQDEVDAAKMSEIKPTEEGRVLIAVVIEDIPVGTNTFTFAVNPYFVKDGVTYTVNTAHEIEIKITGDVAISAVN